jgi:hypothetical protein
VVVNRLDGKSAILDAKYRSEGTQTTQSALSEVQTYMQAYNRDGIGVVFPALYGECTSNEIRDSRPGGTGNRILELGIAPMAELEAFVSDVIWPSIDSLLS